MITSTTVSGAVLQVDRGFDLVNESGDDPSPDKFT
jgi:hypothetical protein